MKHFFVKFFSVKLGTKNKIEKIIFLCGLLLLFPGPVILLFRYGTMPPLIVLTGVIIGPISLAPFVFGSNYYVFIKIVIFILFGSLFFLSFLISFWICKLIFNFICKLADTHIKNQFLFRMYISILLATLIIASFYNIYYLFTPACPSINESYNIIKLVNKFF